MSREESIGVGGDDDGSVSPTLSCSPLSLSLASSPFTVVDGYVTYYKIGVVFSKKEREREREREREKEIKARNRKEGVEKVMSI